ncbi:hypothetical protein HU200_035293 [Digitaria exilis]|uniref:Strictosidine synthase conserved region domain-containing protein n=1 Tax=Digitaria exilis TaxID=1010633 RepID=A0A835BTB4_9POAL|nr:hypothetical protein HU200_035293 [Digitaria exilis]
MAFGLGFFKAVALILGPVALAVALYNPGDFSPAPMPPEYSYGPVVSAPRHEARVLEHIERVGEGKLPGPENLAYDAAGGWLYTGCDDGWVRRVTIPGGDVEDWCTPAAALSASCSPPTAASSWPTRTSERKVEALTDAAEGVKFAMTDGVDVAADGTIYFTDASYKYNLANHMTDILEARPHGRLLSFDPATGRTAVLGRDLYFANGVAEEMLEGRTLQWDLLMKYPFVRKLVYLVDKFVAVPHGLKNAGAISVTLEGEPMSMYTDPGLALATGWLKVGKHLYYGSLTETYLSRIDLTKSSAELHE